MKRHVSRLRRLIAPKSLLVAVVTVVAGLGIYLLAVSLAASSATSLEAESGTLSGGATVQTGTQASNGSYVKFGQPTGNGGVTPQRGLNCNYQTDTWNGDANNVGYSVTKLSANNGNPAGFSVKLDANPGTTEVVGYPSDQCLMYSALPSNLASAFDVTPPSGGTNLDYEFAYDIWVTTAAKATANNWSGSLELMIWTYNDGQRPAGSIKATLADGSKVWVGGSNTTGIVSVVLPGNPKTGVVDIDSIISQLKSLGYISNTYDGLMDVEFGIEAPYGGGQTFTVNSVVVGQLQ